MPRRGLHAQALIEDTSPFPSVQALEAAIGRRHVVSNNISKGTAPWRKGRIPPIDTIAQIAAQLRGVSTLRLLLAFARDAGYELTEDTDAQRAIADVIADLPLREQRIVTAAVRNILRSARG